MKLKIEHYIDRGNFDKERIAFKAQSDCDLKFYVVHKTQLMDSGGFYNRPKYTFWFPPTNVKAGDWIVLYTKKGSYSSKTTAEGTTSHFFYWDLSQSIFNKKYDGIVLAELETWQTKWIDE